VINTFDFLLFVIAIGASAVGGMLGMAGGIFVVPLLTTFMKVEIHTAIGASLVSVIACSCSSAAPFLKERLTNIRLALVLEIATTLGALSGVLLFGIIPTQYLFLLFALVLIVSAQQMLSRRTEAPLVDPKEKQKHWIHGAGLASAYPDRTLGRDVHYQVRRLPVGMALMYGAGLISALLGIGSGVLKIPAMDTALRLPIKVSSATSNFMIGVTAAASAGAYFLRGEINPTITAPIVIGSVIGSLLGARILLRISNQKIRLLFVIVLVVLAAQMILSSFGVHILEGLA